jgi:hypothetical protein
LLDLLTNIRLIAPTDAPIEYETITFFEKEGHDSPYFGPSDPGTDAAWGALLTSMFCFLPIFLSISNPPLPSSHHLSPPIPPFSHLISFCS